VNTEHCYIAIFHNNTVKETSHQHALRMCVPYSSESKKCGLSLRVRCTLPLLPASDTAEPAEIQQPIIDQLKPTSHTGPKTETVQEQF